MNYILTQHALEVVQERGIQIEWIEWVLKRPGLVEIDKNDRVLENFFAKIPEFGNRILKVVVNRRIEPLRIITVYFDRKMKGKL